MTTKVTKRTTGASLTPCVAELMGDFRSFLDETSIVSLVETAVDEIVSTLPPWRGSDALPNPKTMLRLLTYSYLVCKFASDDIHAGCESDAATKYLAEGNTVSQEAIRTFRRANRPWIEQCVALVIEKVAAQSTVLSARAQLSLVQPETPSESPALQLARRRVELAILLDMALAD